MRRTFWSSVRTRPLFCFSLPTIRYCFVFSIVSGRGADLDSITPLPLTAFADVLEQLESQFYSEALAKFKEKDFTDAGFTNAQLAIEQFISIQTDEATHSVVLRVCPHSWSGRLLGLI